TGSTVIAEFESLEAAQSWADADPYVAAGVYAQVSVKPYKKIFLRITAVIGESLQVGNQDILLVILL
ncbi:YciI family protein, partial [Salmonella enterica subsp. enterica serovar Montevideo]|nr:YciI family protein [Salmonella enterica subsp. enterica serovar Montevideo]